jgi:anti-sigma factor ChrR (cupin superfamily)
MKPIQPHERRIANIHSARYAVWAPEGGAEPGTEVLQLNDGKPLGVGFHIYRMGPGSRTDAHEHHGDEEFLVLEGELVDNDGTVYRPGDLVWLKDGTQHSSYTEKGCLLAVFVDRPETMLAAKKE